MSAPPVFLTILELAAAPAATAAQTYTLPESVSFYRLKTVIIELITVVAVANRQVVLTILSREGNTKQIVSASAVQLASQDLVYTFGATGAPYVLGSFAAVPLQGMILEPGDIVRLSCTAAQAGDTWGPEGTLYFEAI